MKRVALRAPLAIFALVFVVVISGLVKPGETVVRSAMVGKPVPDFALPAMVAGKPGLSAATFRQGEPRLLNVFASWCIPCIAEAPQLMRLKAMGIPIDAIAIRDTTPAIASIGMPIVFSRIRCGASAMQGTHQLANTLSSRG